MTTTYLIFAGTWEDFHDYLHEHMTPETADQADHEEFIFVDEVASAYGFDFRHCVIVKANGWETHVWAEQVIDDIEGRIRIATRGGER